MTEVTSGIAAVVSRVNRFQAVRTFSFIHLADRYVIFGVSTDFRLAALILPLEALRMEAELNRTRVTISIGVFSFEGEKLFLAPYQDQGVKFGS